MGHFPVPRPRARLEPDDIGQNVPDPEGERRRLAYGGEQSPPFPNLPAGFRQGSPRQQAPGEKHGNEKAEGPHPPPRPPRGPGHSLPHLFTLRLRNSPPPVPFHEDRPTASGPGIRYSRPPRGARSFPGQIVSRTSTPKSPRGAEAPPGVPPSTGESKR